MYRVTPRMCRTPWYCVCTPSLSVTVSPDAAPADLLDDRPRVPSQLLNQLADLTPQHHTLYGNFL